MSNNLRHLNSQTPFCSICFNDAVGEVCQICADISRDHQIITVVEEPRDVLAVESMDVHKGVYHVLHGKISPINGIGPNDIRIRELVERVDKGNNLEVIIATNPGLEGDATAMYIQRELAGKGVKLTRLARGLP